MQRKAPESPVKAPADPELAILQALGELRTRRLGEGPAGRLWLGAQEHARQQALLRAAPALTMAPEPDRRRTARALHPAIKV
jgi:hypothetical protein